MRKEEAQDKPIPSPGDSLVVLGGFGQQIRGIFINGVQYRYVTREEAEAERVAWLADYERRKDEAYKENLESWLARANKLDGPFADRIARFEGQGFEEFWREDGGYELFVVEQANQLYRLAAGQADPVQWLDAFYKAKWEEQKYLFPELDEGHSGNTFGGMVGLAKAVARGESI